MSEDADLALLLEADTYLLIRVLGIFLIGSIAFITFTSKGKIFSIISLLISFAINVTLIVNYYMEKDRIAKLGFYPKTITEIIVIIMIFVALFTLWILYEVMQTEPVSLATIAKDIETKMSENNAIYLENLRSLSGKSDTPTIESKNGTISSNLAQAGENKSRVNFAALAVSA